MPPLPRWRADLLPLLAAWEQALRARVWGRPVEGTEVLVGSSATTMEDGKMVEREGGRRLGDEANAVQTGQALTPSPLSSASPAPAAP